MNPNPARIAEIKRMIDDPALDPMKRIARLVNAVFDVIMSGQRGELEAALIAKGWSKAEIKEDLPAALCFINEFGDMQK